MSDRLFSQVYGGTGSHPASYSRGQSGREVKLTSYFKIVLRLSSRAKPLFQNYGALKMVYNSRTYFPLSLLCLPGTAVARWLRCCSTNLKVAGSIPGFLIGIKSFRSYYGPGVDSACNRNDYQEYFLGVKAAGA